MVSSDPSGRSQRERMLSGELYIADDPELAAESRRALKLMEQFNRSSVEEPELRKRLLDELLGGFGEGSELRPPFFCDYGRHITIGARITIGDDVQVGPSVQLLTPTHPVEPDPRRAKWEAARPIVIKDNVWLGGGAIALPGVTVGANSVVGAGAVVTRSLPPGVVAAGNPARVIREI